MRIVVYPMQEAERAAAEGALADVEVDTAGALVGAIDQAGIDQLDAAGVIFEQLPEDVGTRSARTSAPRPTTDGVADDDRPRRYVIRLDGPLSAPHRNALEDARAELVDRVPGSPYEVIARMAAADADIVAGFDFVFDVGPYGLDVDPVGGAIHDDGDSTDIRMARDVGTVAATPPESRTTLTFDVMAETAQDVANVVTWLEGRGITVLGHGARKVRIVLRDDSTVLDDVRQLAEVEDVFHYVPPRLHLDRALQLIGVHDAVGQQRLISQTGAGQVIGIADTGIDETHPDLQPPRLGAVFALGRSGDATDPHGHGTHVASISAGDGSASAGRFMGAAPEAAVVFQSLLDANGGLGGLPIDLGDLFQQAYDEGVRVHNNSWGSNVSSEYVLNSQDVDEFVATHRDLLIVVSAGNEGQAADRVTSDAGIVDLASITAPASAKNALTVGASRSDRQTGGFSNHTYGDAWPASFPDAPIGDALVSGDPAALAAFSSRGPSLPTRIKPDLVAPGTDIAAAKSSLAPLHNFWGPVPNTEQYAFMGGTSMSSPLVAGCAALIREYFSVVHQHESSAALLKATLINGATAMDGEDAVALHDGVPNYNQGFGCVNVPRTIPNDANPDLELTFWDVPIADGLDTNDRLIQTVRVEAGGDLRVCLCWTDPPGRSLVNNLTLVVIEPDGTKHTGNSDLPVQFSRLDTENNVEIVRIGDAAAGAYRVAVIGQNVLKPPQDFALVVTGHLERD